MAVVPVNVAPLAVALSYSTPVTRTFVAVVPVNVAASTPTVTDFVVGTEPAVNVSAAFEPPLKAVIFVAEPVVAEVNISVSLSLPEPTVATTPSFANVSPL